MYKFSTTLENDNTDIVLLVCDRCGKQFFGLISRSSYTCDTCHETSLLCPECQENINCYCGRTMRLTDGEYSPS